MVFNEGSIYCCFHSSFKQKFKQAADRWSEGKREAGDLRHEHSFPRDYIPSDKLGQGRSLQEDGTNDLSPQAQQALQIHQVVSAPEPSHINWLEQIPYAPHRTGHEHLGISGQHFMSPSSAVPSTVRPNSSVSNQTYAVDSDGSASIKQKDRLRRAEDASHLHNQYQSPRNQPPERVLTDVNSHHIVERPSTPDRAEKWVFRKLWPRSSPDEKKNNNTRRP